MEEVIVTCHAPVSRTALESKLSPETIVDYAGTYEVVSCERLEDKWHVVATEDELEIELSFTELEDGYVYEQWGDAGPFAEMMTEITVRETDSGARIKARSEFTFGSLFAFIIDRLATSSRKRELRRLLKNIVSEVNEPEERTDADS